MPSAAYKSGPELRIELDNIGGPQHPCQPGDVITGRITRSVPGVSPRTTISLRLLGRAKTKIVVTRSNGQSSSRSVYRNRFNFFGTTQTRQFLHDGPLHIAPGGEGGGPSSWPFAIDVPLHPLPAAVRSEGGTSDTCFLSLQPEDIASAPLPGSFFACGRHRDTRFETYVEYHLEAELLDSGSHGKAVTAVLPIQMRARPTMPYPLVDFDMQRQVLQGQISTYHLVPGMEHAELTFKQKTKQFMGSRKVPMFGFSVQVECPAVIQLGNPTPTVVLNSLELILKAHTSTVAPTTFGTKHADDTMKHNISLPVVALGNLINPPTDTNNPLAGEGGESSAAAAQPKKPFGVVLPSRWEVGKEAALDIGTAIDFRLFSTHATALGKPIARTSSSGDPIHPAFTTYCIRHSAALKWKAEIEIAGQTEKFEAQQAVTIVGPSESGARPLAAATAQPSEKSEQLPSYGENALGGPSGSSARANTVEEDLPVYTK